MKIEIIRYDGRDAFTVALRNGPEPFLKIHGCRVKEGGKGRFISWPARKDDAGKWWNHCWGSEAFQAAILKAFDAEAPKRQAPPRQEKPLADMDEDIPW